jgi:hypothetical protein
MTTVQPESQASAAPSPRAIRLWTGLLVAFWLLLQIVAVKFSFTQSMELQRQLHHPPTGGMGYPVDYDISDLRAAFWHASVVGVGIAALAFVFIVGAVGLILSATWAWRVLLVGAVLQILFTIATQVWQATLSEDLGLVEGSVGWAVLGILIWNIIPVRILLLVLASQPLGGKRKPIIGQVAE